MTIYDFSLASGYAFTGVDAAICYRAGILKNAGYDVKQIFICPPSVRDFDLYLERGVDIESIVCMQLAFTDFRSLKPGKKVQEAIDELKESTGYTDVRYGERQIDLVKGGGVVASLHLTKDREYFYNIYYLKQNYLVRVDWYSDCRYASWFYETRVDANGVKHAELSNRVYYNRDGSVAFTQLKTEKSEYTIFDDGTNCNNEQLFALFMQKLNLKQDDVLLIDRTMTLFPMKSLLACHNNTRIVAVIHSEHYFEKGKSVEGYYLNREYWYWFKYSHYIHGMIVGTDLQKERLAACLEDYNLAVPHIQVLPPYGLDKLRYPEQKRKKKSLLCISRLDNRKKIEWTIYTAIKAHDADEEIVLDIFGMGSQEYLDYLNEIIEKNQANGYITLKGFMDVTEQYKNYEVFLTTSLWETFGIALLEAAGSGLPVVGLDVEYGNTQFIREGENGYRIPYNRDHYSMECPEEVDLLAEKVVEILSDDEKREKFSQKSYEIAEEYLPDKMEEKWVNYLQGRNRG